MRELEGVSWTLATRNCVVPWVFGSTGIDLNNITVIPILSDSIVLCSISNCYRPQRSWAKVIFSQACVKKSVHTGGEGVCLSACWDTLPPDQAEPPPGPGRPSPGTDTTLPPGPGRPPRADPPRPGRPTPPGSRHPPDQADPPPGSRLQHTVYERPVRILLECILVFLVFATRAKYHWFLCLVRENKK